MEEEPKQEIIDLCYKIKNIYVRGLIRITNDYAARDKINTMFFSINHGVVRKVVDFIETKQDASEEEFSKFVESIVNQAKEDTIRLISQRNRDKNAVENAVNNSYDDIISAIIEEREKLSKALNENEEVKQEETENETEEEKNNEKPEIVEESMPDSNHDLDDEPELNSEFEPDSLEELDEIEERFKLDEEEAKIFEEVIDEEKSNEEIDEDLEDFENQESQILHDKRFTPEQKSELIDQLYKEFDEYVEENPEIGGRQI